MNIHTLTLRANGLALALKCTIRVTTPHLETQIPQVGNEYMAIWDTGATNSVVTPKVVQELGLQQTGAKLVQAAGISEIRPTYLVDLVLPNGVAVQSVEVTESTLTDSDDVLIGMDIITNGDFSITNFQGKTVMSFRIPSIREVDFVAEANEGPIALDRRERRKQERAAKKRNKRNKN